jgi:hypothetical protein
MVILEFIADAVSCRSGVLAANRAGDAAPTINLFAMSGLLGRVADDPAFSRWIIYTVFTVSDSIKSSHCCADWLVFGNCRASLKASLAAAVSPSSK